MTLLVPESECTFTFSRSGGAGGQNVNKVSTKVTLSWDFLHSAVLSEGQRDVLRNSEYFIARRAADGQIVIHEQRARTQAINRKLALEKLNELLAQALKPRKKRHATKVGRAQKAKRLDQKKMRSRRLQSRRLGAE